MKDIKLPMLQLGFQIMVSTVATRENASRALIVQQLLETMLPGTPQARLLEDFLADVDLTICHNHHACPFTVLLPQL